MLFSGFFCFLCEERLVNYCWDIPFHSRGSSRCYKHGLYICPALLVIMLYSKLRIFTFGVATEVHCCLLNFISGS